LNNTTRFAEDVMPRLRPLWSEWEDKWWVQAAPSSASANSAQRLVSASTSD
jgi:hypothetical protein